MHAPLSFFFFFSLFLDFFPGGVPLHCFFLSSRDGLNSYYDKLVTFC